ncbi:MAG: hypothetical protein BroJett018_26660 [Chloroflexota bacterium]|nr:MAG: hypothetical protein BroJett018_26660 [Chloroflexota bacterium]
MNPLIPRFIFHIACCLLIVAISFATFPPITVAQESHPIITRANAESVLLLDALEYPEISNGLQKLAWSPDGTTLAAMQYDRILLWDAATHSLRVEFYVQNGTRLASVGVVEFTDRCGEGFL